MDKLINANDSVIFMIFQLWDFSSISKRDFNDTLLKTDYCGSVVFSYGNSVGLP